jgi:hypothetical protein
MKKIPLRTIVLLILAAAGTALSSLLLCHRPLPVFVLKGGAEAPEAYKILFSMGGGETTVEPLKLTADQKKKAAGILRRADAAGLGELAREAAHVEMAVGLPESAAPWPWYFGGGLKSLKNREAVRVFDNLGILDRWYFVFALKTPTSTPPAALELNLDLAAPTPATPIRGTPEPSMAPVSQGALRVEILNGCGITGAADWAAKRLRGGGITIVNIENADNFRYSKTVVRSSVGMPAALKEALSRLGLPEKIVAAAPAPAPGRDVTVIVGKDYLNLRGRSHGRIRR